MGTGTPLLLKDSFYCSLPVTDASINVFDRSKLFDSGGVASKEKVL